MNWLKHVVVIFKRTLSSGKEYTTVIDADPTQEAFPYISFDLRTEAANPYPHGTVSFLNLHELGQAALPGGICVVRAGYYREGEWPPVIYAGRPFSIETDWGLTDSRTTIGLGLPGHFFSEVTFGPIGRTWRLWDIIDRVGATHHILLDSAQIQSQLVTPSGEPIRIYEPYSASEQPFHEWLTAILEDEDLGEGTAFYWQYVPDDLQNFSHVQIFHQSRVDPNRSVTIRQSDMVGIPSPKLSLEGDTGVDVEILLDPRLRLSTGIKMQFEDQYRASPGGFSNWRPVEITHSGDNYRGSLTTKLSVRAIQ